MFLLRTYAKENPRSLLKILQQKGNLLGKVYQNTPPTSKKRKEKKKCRYSQTTLHRKTFSSCEGRSQCSWWSCGGLEHSAGCCGQHPPLQENIITSRKKSFLELKWSLGGHFLHVLPNTWWNSNGISNPLKYQTAKIKERCCLRKNRKANKRGGDDEPMEPTVVT